MRLPTNSEVSCDSYSINVFQWTAVTAVNNGFTYIQKHEIKPGEKLLISSFKYSESDVLSRGRDSSSEWFTYKQTDPPILCCIKWNRQTKEVKEFRLYGANQAVIDLFYNTILKEITPIDVIDNKVSINFWHCSPSEGPDYSSQTIKSNRWDDIRVNYPVSIVAKLEELCDYRPSKDTEHGKIILFHGCPGSGKTFMLRALMEKWKSWCAFSYIMDPDILLQRTDYLIRVFSIKEEFDSSGYDEEGDPIIAPPNTTKQITEKYNLIILEDCGELVSKDAKLQTGQGIAKILNISDGILGQGNKSLILITTNEEIGELHDAISRPGRCLSNIEFPKFTPEEANNWLGLSLVKNWKTLAELFEIKNTSQKMIRTGQARHKVEF